ncbi:transporter, major facilitator family protein [Actinomyces urogenitalis DSM 15434]|uniref:Transporter, major facilitator family protein n=3 Tax=Actinomyces urogenitalis TaxID=103621 RepID=C0W4K3_9ACTO|nr:MFS transporter [Actinomyces urogenitalis]EEH66337.1 transporter, major facilitator family protein [Actinomyces urogenitalis DSM 15434]MBS6071976.1 MFS transporter [Actinomyces urogenitalis]MDK8834625.1 MFS transporter [Actinomyces urogenitalis]
MASTAAADPRLEEPTRPGTSAKYLGGRPFIQYVISFIISSLFLFACYAAMAGILLPNSVQTIEFQHYFDGTTVQSVNDVQQLTQLRQAVDAGTATATGEEQHLLDLLAQYEGARAKSISLMMSIGSLFTLFAQPVIGVISDRWRSKFGRRAMWIVMGAIGGAVFMVGLRYSSTIAMLTLFWTVGQVSLNIMQAPLSTTVADRVPQDKVGLVSGLSGIGMMLGFTGGSIIAGILFNTLGLDTYFVFALGVVIGALLFVTFAKDRSSKDLEVEKFDWISFFKGYTIPLRDHDFRWTWIARFFMFFGYTAISNFVLYILQSHLQPALSASEANTTFATLSSAALPGQLLMMLVAGRWSDKVGRRKPFVIGSSIVIAALMALPLLFPSLPIFYVFYIGMAAAYGMYMAVDTALFIDVLPDPEAAGRDLGVANVATNIGQMLAPVVAGQVVAITAGYDALFIMSVVSVVIAALAIIPVRKIK